MFIVIFAELYSNKFICDPCQQNTILCPVDYNIINVSTIVFPVRHFSFKDSSISVSAVGQKGKNVH